MRGGWLTGRKLRITRRGEPVARMTGVGRERQPIDFAALRAMPAAMPRQPEPARAWLRRERDAARH